MILFLGSRGTPQHVEAKIVLYFIINSMKKFHLLSQNYLLIIN